MYVKIVASEKSRIVRVARHVYANPETTLIECDEVRYTENHIASSKELDDMVVAYRTGSYETFGRVGQEFVDDLAKSGSVWCLVLCATTHIPGCAIPSTRIIVVLNHHVFIMNNAGKTIDSIIHSK